MRPPSNSTADGCPSRARVPDPLDRPDQLGRHKGRVADRLTAGISVGPVRTTGRLGATRIKSSMDPLDLDGDGRPVAARPTWQCNRPDGRRRDGHHGGRRPDSHRHSLQHSGSPGTERDHQDRRIRRGSRREALLRRPRHRKGVRLRRGARALTTATSPHNAPRGAELKRRTFHDHRCNRHPRPMTVLS